MPYHNPIPNPKPRGKAPGVVDAIVQAEKMIQVALILPCAAFLGWLAGAWLDSRLHQKWIGLAGIVFGGVSGLVYAVRLALAAANRGEDGGQHPKQGGSAGTAP
ncbi:MAG TPA: AtpZ/AtpI family protein [Terracidiphilus sp.]|nr:AtpZ/AtpI family protein [Terracidiphilus sp.]